MACTGQYWTRQHRHSIALEQLNGTTASIDHRADDHSADETPEVVPQVVEQTQRATNQAIDHTALLVSELRRVQSENTKPLQRR